MNLRKEKNVLILETGVKINFDFPISGVIDNNSTDSILVQLNVSDAPMAIENVFCISKEKGIMLWKHRMPDTEIVSKEKVHHKSLMDWAKEGNILIIENNKRVTFDYPIGCVIETSGIIIVSLDVPPKQVMTENVFGVSREGKILWQIEKIPETATNPINRYVDLRENLSSDVVAGNWNGMEAYLDAETGKIIKTEFTK